MDFTRDKNDATNMVMVMYKQSEKCEDKNKIMANYPASNCNKVKSQKCTFAFFICISDSATECQ